MVLILYQVNYKIILTILKVKLLPYKTLLAIKMTSQLANLVIFIDLC